MKKISMILAIAEDGTIGNNNELPWKIPEDLKLFRKHTLNKTVVMGRKTFESIGSKPLPNRNNIVVSRTLENNNVTVVNSLEDAINKSDGEVMIIGGVSLYKQALPIIDRLYISRVKGSYNGDTKMDMIDTTKGNLIHSEEFDDFIFEIFEF